MKRDKKSKLFKQGDYNPLFIPTPNRDEVIAEGTLAWMVDEFVNKLDLTELIERYEDDGKPPYHPKDLLKIIILAYAENEYGCRGIARLASYDFRYMYLCGFSNPSFNTINRFRTNRLGLERTKDIFNQLVTWLSNKGYIDIENVSVDGTTIESRASRHQLRYRKTQRRYAYNNNGNIKELIKELVSQVDKTQTEEAREIMDIVEKHLPPTSDDDDNDAGLPGSVHLSQEETDRIRNNAETLQNKGAIGNAVAGQLRDRADKADRYRAMEQKCGERSSTALTDADAIALHPKDDLKHGGPVLAMHNMMIASSRQFIVFCDLLSYATDNTAYAPFLSHFLDFAQNLSLKNLIGDAGFGDYKNVLLTEQHHLMPYFKHNMYDKECKARYTPDPFQVQNFKEGPDGTLICPGGGIFRINRQQTECVSGVSVTKTQFRTDYCAKCKLVEQCMRYKTVKDGYRMVDINYDWWINVKPKLDERLNSPEGKMLLKSRSREIEPIFSHFKYDGKYNRLRHFSKPAYLMDASLKSIAYNLKKLWRIIRKAHGKGFSAWRWLCIDATNTVLRIYHCIYINFLYSCMTPHTNIINIH